MKKAPEFQDELDERLVESPTARRFNEYFGRSKEDRIEKFAKFASATDEHSRMGREALERKESIK